MKIQRIVREDGLELDLAGRLDAYWAETLDVELADQIRTGARNLRLRMAAIIFLSSAGIRILVKYFKEMDRLKGTLQIVAPSEAVRTVLELSGLGGLLAQEASSVSAPEKSVADQNPRREAGPLSLTIYRNPTAPPLPVRALGDPERLPNANYRAGDMHTLAITNTCVAVGLGALGGGFEECKTRFGEFLAVGGAALCLPADGAGTPDYLLATGNYQPQTQLLHALVMEGEFSHFMHYETREGVPSVPLSCLVRQGAEILEAETFAMVMIGETTGLVGASLKRPPVAEESPQSLFDFPGIRAWLSFTPQRVHANSLAVVVGFATSIPNPGPSAFLRPFGPEPAWLGHFHAAPFSYRALPKGPLDLSATIPGLFESSRALGLHHLLWDGRPISGVGESEFVRGAIWMGPASLSTPVSVPREVHS